VGFPGETEAEFSESVAFAREVGFAKAHVFAYSQRPGTVAAAMPDQIPRPVKTRRAKEMAAAMDECRLAFLGKQVGRSASVLFEQRLPDGRWEGYTENYTPIALDSPADLAGQVLPVRITAVDGDVCVGVL
jgi:threonylcarbamoyladenosine tRNA methylthiotransferase MtaB